MNNRQQESDGSTDERNQIRSIIDIIGNTPLVEVQRLAENSRGNRVLCKLEGDNPAGSVKDRPAANMILQAMNRGQIKAGDTLIEATSGNTGIALAMVSAAMGINMTLIMPDNMTQERKDAMSAYGARLILVTQEQGMEYARDLADDMASRGEGVVLNQFANPDNWQAHYNATGPEILSQTEGRITHFVSSMGTTGTIMGCSRYLKDQNPDIRIVGVQPREGSQIPGIRKWPVAYQPAIYEPERVDELRYVSASEAEQAARDLARTEGIFGGVSSGGAFHVARELARTEQDATIVTIVCDRGDRYLSSGLFSDPAG